MCKTVRITDFFTNFVQELPTMDKRRFHATKHAIATVGDLFTVPAGQRKAINTYRIFNNGIQLSLVAGKQWPKARPNAESTPLQGDNYLETCPLKLET